MTRLIGLVAVLAALYAGYWYVGAQTVEAGAQAVLDDARANRWGDAKGVSLAGFPSRFDLTFDGPQVQSPDGMYEWRASVAQLFALSYRPNALIAWLPPEQELRIGRTVYRLRNEDMRASARFGIEASVPLAEATAVIETPAVLASGPEPVAKARQLRAAITQTEPLADAPSAPAYRVGLEALDVTGTALDEPLGRMTLDAVASFDAPLDRQMAETGEVPRPRIVDLRGLHLDWGGKRLDATGQLTLDRTGNPTGVLELRLRDWRAWLNEAALRGLIDPRQQTTIANVARGLAGQSEDGALLLPLGFRGGMTYLGPFALGPAPRFW